MFIYNSKAAWYICSIVYKVSISRCVRAAARHTDGRRYCTIATSINEKDMSHAISRTMKPNIGVFVLNVLIAMLLFVTIMDKFFF